jgi:alanyl-tRNA synthetase
MKLIVNKENRIAKMRAHTATHLLHAELNKIIENTKQAGSLVDDDYIRFDFHTDKPLTLNQIENIEQNINELIFCDISVNVEEMSLDEALKT